MEEGDKEVGLDGLMYEYWAVLVIFSRVLFRWVGLSLGLLEGGCGWGGGASIDWC